jgi:hypothetical protein
MKFETKHLPRKADAIAPDGSEVRVLCQLSRGGLALFSLPPNTVSKAVAHRTVEEVCGTSFREKGACGASSANRKKS